MATPLDDRTTLLGPQEAPPRGALVVCCAPHEHAGSNPCLSFKDAESAASSLPLLVEVSGAAVRTSAVALAGADAPLLAGLIMLGRRQALPVIQATLPGLTDAHKDLLARAEKTLPGGRLVFAQGVRPPQVVPPRASPPQAAASSVQDLLPQTTPINLPGVVPGQPPTPSEGPVERVVVARDQVQAASEVTPPG